jgi:hypothetical protein
MDKIRRRELVENYQYTFNGETATVAGYENPCASVTTNLPGFYRATWEEIEKAANTNGVIHEVYLVSNAWLGC